MDRFVLLTQSKRVHKFCCGRIGGGDSGGAVVVGRGVEEVWWVMEVLEVTLAKGSGGSWTWRCLKLGFIFLSPTVSFGSGCLYLPCISSPPPLPPPPPLSPYLHRRKGAID